MPDANEHSTDNAKYEPTDVSISLALIIAVILVVSTALAFLAGYFALGAARAKPAATDFEPSPLVEPRQDFAQGPRLQKDPRDELNAHLAETRPALNQYGVVSENPEIYHFPIEDAIDHIAEHGLPEFTPLGQTQETQQTGHGQQN